MERRHRLLPVRRNRQRARRRGSQAMLPQRARGRRTTPVLRHCIVIGNHRRTVRIPQEVGERVHITWAPEHQGYGKILRTLGSSKAATA